jgi:hypothetical protein
MRLASIVLLATVSLGAAPGAAFDLPPRKPGLWELSQTTNIGPNNSHTEVVQHCVDTDALLRRLEMTRLQQAKCTRMDLRREDGAVVLDAECKALVVVIALLIFMSQAAASQFAANGSADQVPAAAAQAQLAQREASRTCDASRSSSAIPDRLRYLFDLPWCSAWFFKCSLCEKQGDGISCRPVDQNCQEDFSIFRCRGFVVPDTCDVWSDGCNYCDRGGCTARACVPYTPRYQCLQPR